MDNYIIDLADFQLTQKDFFIRLFVAVGIGFLIGLEREYSSISNKIESFAGIRTFTFVVLLGFIAVMMNYLLSMGICRYTDGSYYFYRYFLLDHFL